MGTIEQFLSAYIDTLCVSKAEKKAQYHLLEKYPEAGWYVYLLIDPRDDKIFYVGKGIADRVNKHEERTRRGVLQNPTKVKKIQDILCVGQKVKKRVLVMSENEDEILAIEDKVIKTLAQYGLTNIIGGEHIKNKSVKKMADMFRDSVTNIRNAFVGG